jgi:hypothetical protein
MFLNRFVIGASVLAVVVGLSSPAAAQEITETHLEAALEVIKASPASRSFDDLLPATAEAVKSQLILMRPDLHRQIGETVDEVAVEMVPRRAELDLEVARVWAGVFTEDELVTILAFYESPAGKKFNQLGPDAIAKGFVAAEKWSVRMREELAERVQEVLVEKGVDF